jgi:hypothetical protein
MSRLQKKPPAHKRGHPTLQNMNFFLLLWVIFARLDPDPHSNYGSGSGSTTLNSSSLKSEHLTLQIQNFNFLYFCGSFRPSWIRIRTRIPNEDPDPADRNECGSGSTTLALITDFLDVRYRTGDCILMIRT